MAEGILSCKYDKLLQILKEIGVGWRKRKLISQSYMNQGAIL